MQRCQSGEDVTTALPVPNMEHVRYAGCAQNVAGSRPRRSPKTRSTQMGLSAWAATRSELRLITPHMGLKIVCVTRVALFTVLDSISSQSKAGNA